MSHLHPIECHPLAYYLFRDQLEQLEAPSALLRAALAVSMHELSDVKPETCEHQLDQLASQIRQRVQSDSQAALIAHFHQVLFDKEGFTGNRETYYDPVNSYLPMVLEKKQGIPITLTLVYKFVADRLGLTVHGINAPAHFLAKVKLDNVWTFVDPFFGGQVLSRPEALKRVEQMMGHRLPTAPKNALTPDQPVMSHDPIFPRASHRQWLARILRNLRAVFHHQQRDRDVRAMQELYDLL